MKHMLVKLSALAALGMLVLSACAASDVAQATLSPAEAAL